MLVTKFIRKEEHMKYNMWDGTRRYVLVMGYDLSIIEVSCIHPRHGLRAVFPNVRRIAVKAAHTYLKRLREEEDNGNG